MTNRIKSIFQEKVIWEKDRQTIVDTIRSSWDNNTIHDVEKEICSGICLANENIELYNQKAQAFFNKLNADKKAYFIVGKGRSHKEQTVIVYEPGVFVGFCYTSNKVQLDFDVLRDEAQPLKLNQTMEAILAPFINTVSKEYKVYAQLRMTLK